MIIPRLFWEFFKVGLFSIGGGQASIPFLFHMSEKTGWFTVPELANMIAVSESTPGPIGVNMATYVGYTTKGIPGAFVSTLGLVMPSVIIIEVIASVLMSFDKKPVIQTVFKYLRPTAVGLIGFALFKVASITLVAEGKIELIRVAFFLFVFALSRIFKKVHPIVFICAGALFGILFL